MRHWRSSLAAGVHWVPRNPEIDVSHFRALGRHLSMGPAHKHRSDIREINFLMTWEKTLVILLH